MEARVYVELVKPYGREIASSKMYTEIKEAPHSGALRVCLALRVPRQQKGTTSSATSSAQCSCELCVFRDKLARAL